MHNAPPVVYPVGRFVWGPAIGLLLAGAGALGLGIWQKTTGLSWPLGVWAAWAGLALVFAWLEWRYTPGEGALAWRDEAWFWQAHGHEEVPVRLSVWVDAGAGLWLCLQVLNASGANRGLSRFVWVREKTMSSKWHGFRCAVYSRPKTTSEARLPV